MWTVCERAVLNMLLRAVARGPGVRDAGGGGAGEGERSSVVAAIEIGRLIVR